MSEHYLRSLPVPEDYHVLLPVYPNIGSGVPPSMRTGPTVVTTSQYWLINYCQTVIYPALEVHFALPADQADWIELVAATSKVLRVEELLGLNCMFRDSFTAGLTFTAHFAEYSNRVHFGAVTFRKGQMVSAHCSPNDSQLPYRCGIIHCFSTMNLSFRCSGKYLAHSDRSALA